MNIGLTIHPEDNTCLGCQTKRKQQNQNSKNKRKAGQSEYR